MFGGEDEMTQISKLADTKAKPCKWKNLVFLRSGGERLGGKTFASEQEAKADAKDAMQLRDKYPETWKFFFGDWQEIYPGSELLFIIQVMV